MIFSCCKITTSAWSTIRTRYQLLVSRKSLMTSVSFSMRKVVLFLMSKETLAPLVIKSHARKLISQVSREKSHSRLIKDTNSERTSTACCSKPPSLKRKNLRILMKFRDFASSMHTESVRMMLLPKSSEPPTTSLLRPSIEPMSSLS